MSPWELCQGWGLAVLPPILQQMGGFTPFPGVEVIAPGWFPSHIYVPGLIYARSLCVRRQQLTSG